MFRIYWMENDVPQTKLFDTSKMTEALKFSELLRGNSENSFIVMSSQHPDCVGKQGVDVTGPDYDWKKRRI